MQFIFFNANKVK